MRGLGRRTLSRLPTLQPLRLCPPYALGEAYIHSMEKAQGSQGLPPYNSSTSRLPQVPANMAEHGPPMVIDVHTPVSSFAIVYSGVFPWYTSCVVPDIYIDAEDTLHTIFTKLTQKAFTELHGKPVRAGYVKYEWNSSFYNLDDGTTWTQRPPRWCIR